jgi:hypothetical protein
MLPTDDVQATPRVPARPVPDGRDPDHEFNPQDDLEVPLDEPELPAAPLADDDAPEVETAE